MKMNKSISALALVLGLAAASEAQQTIYITGSTAFHNQVGAALTAMGFTFSQGSAGATTFTCSGTVSGISGSIIVEADFAGSAEGLNSVGNSVSPGYLTPGGAADNPSYGADLAFSDVVQATTSYANVAGGALPEITASDAPAGRTGVAIQPFGWFANEAAINAGISNMTPYLMSTLYGSGSLPLSFWTGNAANTALVYAVGRTNDSGTRVTALVDDGINFTTQINQNCLGPFTNSGLSTPPTGTATWTACGNDGYSSGGNVALALNNNNVTEPAVGYVGLADADSKITGGGAKPITFDGASVGALNNWTLAAVENGAYPFWSYEHLYVNPNSATDVTTIFGPALVTHFEAAINAASPQTALTFPSMNVHRNSDGGPIFSGQ